MQARVLRRVDIKNKYTYNLRMLKRSAIDHFGSVSALAAVLGISRAAIYQWGERVPASSSFRLEVLTGGKLLVDDNDALSDAVRACGGPKKVGALMRPELPADQAGRWVSDCLNREHCARFDPEQVLLLLRLARAVGAHAAMDFMAGSCGYRAPQPLEPEDERARLQREFVAAAGGLIDLAQRLSIDIKLPSALRVVP